jgi:hypothetical protein
MIHSNRATILAILNLNQGVAKIDFTLIGLSRSIVIILKNNQKNLTAETTYEIVSQ